MDRNNLQKKFIQKKFVYFILLLCKTTVLVGIVLRFLNSIGLSETNNSVLKSNIQNHVKLGHARLGYIRLG